MRHMRTRIDLVIALLLAVAAACTSPAGEEVELSDGIFDAVSDASVGELVDLGPLLGSNWDRIVLFDGDPGVATIREALGSDWPGYAPGMRDGTTIALIRDGSIARWAYVPAINDATEGRLVDFEMVGGWIDVNPARAMFVVKSRETSGPVRLCYELCAAGSID